MQQYILLKGDLSLNIKLLTTAIFTVLLLQGCGGGSSDGETTNNSNTGNLDPSKPKPDTSVGRDQNTGKVESNFVATASANYVFIPFNGFSMGKLTASEFPQHSDGSFRELGSYSLTGDKVAVQDIAGNENFAIGRWSWGTANKKDSSTGEVESELLQKSQNYFWTYAVFNRFEASSIGEKKCEATAFTQPYLTRFGAASNSPYLAKTTGTATFNLINATQANLEITLTTSNGTDSRTASYYPGKQADYSPGSGIISGAKVIDPAKSFVSNGEFQISFGQGLAQEVLMFVNYSNQLGDKAPTYSGLAVFTCK
ncbi:hypothetical protein EC844_1147 [Acinetobacter calcoaceticus]|uniref:Uncharacterized protein n=1 Tax=Acinetobacter calcoaceticus TaxID=471 RepID=A0A4R1XTP1_ACICA|nr:hypothetical protein EC844_1147 [Acinetobacter calcoaceticus]